MTAQQCLTVLGAAAGMLGSIITAFSLNHVISELNSARKGIETTLEGVVSNQQNIPVFKGFDKRYDEAVSSGNKRVWFGVFLLVAGFALQWVGACMGPETPN